MKNILINFALWLLSKCGYEKPPRIFGYPIPESVLALVEPAQEAVLGNNDWDASGEAKRHRTYAAMIKQFPQAAKHEIALAIELAILEMKRG